MNTKYTIAIIGVGNLGKRHLSSMLESVLALDVYCYDINQNALDDFIWKDTYNNKNLKMVSQLSEFPSNIDFALFAMTSHNRREMFDDLLTRAEVRNIVFEKVLFQKIEDYAHVKDVLEQKGIHAWVNCGRRQMDAYHRLQAEVSPSAYLEIHVSGGEWGMACNTIHFLDLIQYLAQSKDTKIAQLELQPEIAESKRAGYKEVYGEMTGMSGKCRLFTISCIQNSKLPIRIEVLTESTRYIIDEATKQLTVSSESDQWEMKQTCFDILYQSQMTKDILEDILLRGESHLTDFVESSELHVKFLEELIPFFESKGMEKGVCPIT